MSHDSSNVRARRAVPQPPAVAQSVPQRNRRSIRLQGYDYSQAGTYFVTVCTQNRECLFGEIVNGAMRLNDAGKMIQAVWDEIPAHYPGIDIDAFIIMPNHIHGIVVIVGAGPCACPDPIVVIVGAGPCACPDPGVVIVGAGPCACPDPGGRRDEGQPQGVAPTGLSFPDVVHRFKTMTTKRYADGVKQCGWEPFPGKLWQRNYWEHIVRNETELNRIREYIQNNPAQWESDKLYPNSAPGPNGAPGPNQLREPIAEYGVEAWMT